MFYSRAGENYFSGGTESRLRQTCPSATVTKGLAVRGGSVDSAKSAVESWVK